MNQPHLEKLLSLLEVEAAAQKQAAREAREGKSVQELEAAGLIALDLEAVEEELGLGGRVLVSLEREDHRRLPMRLYPGDLVELRPRRAEVSEPAFAIVSRAGRGFVQVAFDRPPPPFVKEGRLRLDPVPNDVSFARARAAVLALAGKDRGQERRHRDVLLGSEPARFDRPVAFEAGAPLNPEQQDAVAQALSAQDVFLVHGPPGTGKSHVLAEVALQSVRQGLRVLACAASNAAVDHLTELCLDRGIKALRVGHPARVLPQLQPHTLDLLVEEHPDRKLSRDLFDEAFALMGYARKQRSQGRSRERFANARESRSEAKALFDDAHRLERKAVESVLGGAQVICATCTSLDGGVLAGRQFDLVLLDEATQATEPVSLCALNRAPRAVLAGDHRQLPPTVISTRAASEGLAVSLFERLIGSLGESGSAMLLEQHRMNEKIMALPSRTFYESRLRAHPAVAGRGLREVLSQVLPASAPFIFLDTAGKGFDEEVPEGSQSMANPGEAGLLVARARALLDAGLPRAELALIAPYSAQAALLREQLAQEGVEVDTVDAFQGREKDAILLSLVRSNTDGQLGFLKDLRRINVALTRARRHLFVVGDSATLSQHPFYAALVEEAQAQGGYLSAWEWPEA